MYRVRFHGRGGQGIKTASRILGAAFFQAGFEVQDAPRYGAERRGAPIFAYVRASRQPINERGVIQRPDLVIVADETLMPVPAAGVLAGVRPRTVLLVNSHESPESFRRRLNITSPVLILPAPAEADRAELVFIGATCAGAAARLVGVIPRDALEEAIRRELADFGSGIVAKNLEQAIAAFRSMQEHAGCVTEGDDASAVDYETPDWIDLPFEAARVSAPVIHAGLTSVEVKTGLWRTLRPVIDYERCHRCWSICSTLCPDSAINVTPDGWPEIDYDHCKGCMVCVAVCPTHAIDAIPEHVAKAQEEQGKPSA
ncbi:MAG TPA: 2-oxoacid:acceptor oxidoreductase family protein [Nitrospiria bacterium]|nr:2-oxoacid:acceptor oxidoreductase family protein [Nitrospiria bacterium]